MSPWETLVRNFRPSSAQVARYPDRDYDTGSANEPGPTKEAAIEDLLENMRTAVMSECQRAAQEINSTPEALLDQLMELMKPRDFLPSTKDTPRDEELEAKVHALRNKVDLAHREIGRRNEEMRRLGERHLNDNAEIISLRRKEKILRDAVLDNAHSQDVSDEDIIRGFAHLRQRVQSLAQNRVLQASIGNLPLDPTVSSRVQHLEIIWEKAPKKDRAQILRAALFLVLYDYILDRELFGIEASKQAPKTTRRKGLETNLGVFESTMKSRNVSGQAIAEWRLATLKCVELANYEKSDQGHHAAEVMKALLEPFIAQSCSGTDLKSFQDSISQLCVGAYELRMTMRRSRTNYCCLTVEPGNQWKQAKSWADLFGVVNGGTKEMGNTVAYTLFGALAKKTHSTGSFKVLEKAHVIMNQK